MNLLHHTYVIHLIWTFTTFVTLWEDNNPFKNLFALCIKQIKTYSHPCNEIKDNLGFWIPAFFHGIWIPDYSGSIPDSKAQDSRFHKQNFFGFQNFRIPLPWATIQPDLQNRLFYAAFYLKPNKKGVQDITWSPSDWYKPMCWTAKITVTRKDEVFFSLWRPQKTANLGFKAWDQAP